MPRYLGVGPRIAQQLLLLGYKRADGKPDVREFCLERKYDKSIFYEWLGDRSTPTKEMERLATDLGVSRSWLLLGEGSHPRRRPVPIAGGSGPARTPSVVTPIDGLLLIRLCFSAMLARWCPVIAWTPRLACA